MYPAMLALLPLTLASGFPQHAAAQSYPAKYIGAEVYTNPTWAQADTPSSKYYIGSLQSQKFFYNNKPLPGNDAATTVEYHVPGCGARNGRRYVYPTSMLCIIVWNTAASPTGADLHAFLDSTLSDPHHILMAFCNEPEIHQGPKGCECDTTGKTKACRGASAFLAQFKIESDYIRRFESQHHASNVQVAEDSWTGAYSHAPANCGYIVPAHEVSYYLADVYEPTLKHAQNLSRDPGWNGWVSCTRASGVTLGIGEYGIDCGSEHINDVAVAGTYEADDVYLLHHFPKLEVWSLWDFGGCAINERDEPHATASWRLIESGR
jgi:hypothetical protein